MQLCTHEWSWPTSCHIVLATQSCELYLLLAPEQKKACVCTWGLTNAHSLHRQGMKGIVLFAFIILLSPAHWMPWLLKYLWWAVFASPSGQTLLTELAPEGTSMVNWTSFKGHKRTLDTQVRKSSSQWVPLHTVTLSRLSFPCLKYNRLQTRGTASNEAKHEDSFSFRSIPGFQLSCLQER